MADPVFAQTYCTLAEIDEDSELFGSEHEAKIFEKIQSASNFLEKEIGWFLPVAMTLKFNGHGRSRLLIPPLLSLTSLLNDGAAPSATTYALQPDGRHYANGPYSEISALYFTWSYYDNGVEVTGRWGLYEYLKALGATLGAQQAADVITLQVNNGALVSPGMVVVIGDESEFIESTNSTPSPAVTTLNGALDAASDIVAFANGASINIGETIRIDLEQARLLDRNGNTGYLQRGWNKTRKVSHLTGANVDVYRTFNVIRGVNGTSAALHANAAAVSRQMVPADVRQLTLKIASRMLKDSSSGYSGVIGDGMSGNAMYLYILPKELEDIKRNYKAW
jgi:hypothetical protein